MGMSASQARFLGLTARKSNVEYQGQQINQQRTLLANQSASYYNQLLTLDVPTPPDANNYTKVQYSFASGDDTYEIVSGEGGDTVVLREAKEKNQPLKQEVNSGESIIVNYDDDSNSFYIGGAQMTKVLVSSPQVINYYTNGLNPNPPFHYKNYKGYKQDGTPDVDPKTATFSVATDAQINEKTKDATGKENTTGNEHEDYKYPIYQNQLDSFDGELNEVLLDQESPRYYCAQTINEGTSAEKVVYTQLTTENYKDMPENSNIYVERIDRTTGQPVKIETTHYAAQNTEGLQFFVAYDSQALTQENWNNATPEMKNYYANNLDENHENNVLYSYKNQNGFVGYIQYSAIKEAESSPKALVIEQEFYDNLTTSYTMPTMTGVQWDRDLASGRFTQVTGYIGDEDVKRTFKLKCEVIQDEDAYNNAMNDYNYRKAQYEKEMEDLNAKTATIQAQDRTLELNLKQLDTERNALQTEIDAVKKVIEKNIESSFKTFNG